MGTAGMKRSSRVSRDTILRSGKRLFASRYEESVKRMRLTSDAVVDTQEHKVELLDTENQERKIKSRESKKAYRNGAGDVMEIDHEELREIKDNGHRTVEQEADIKSGEFKKTSFVHDNKDEGDNLSRAKKFGIVYTRKRKRTIPCDSSFKCSSLEEHRGSDKMFKNKYFKKRARTNLGSGISNGKDVLWKKGPVILFGPCSYNTSCSIYRFSSFVSSVLRYMRKKVKVFSWKQFISFLLSELTVGIYSSIGIQFSKDSTYIMGHGFLKLFRSIHPILSFTVDFISLPFCFLYIHSTLLLKFAFLSYTLMLHPVVENNIKSPSIVHTRPHHFGKIVSATKPRSSRKRVPNVSLFKKWEIHVDNVVPVPGVREVEGYENEKYVPFRLPDLYISSKSDEVSTTLEKSYPIYDMDSGDEKWLKKFNNELVSEDTFEKIIDAFERGIYCNPDDYSDATSAVDRCLGLASKEVLEAVYRYWMNKRKKKRSPLVRVFQCYRRTRVRKNGTTNTVVRKKRSIRRPKSQRCVGKQVDFLKGMMNEQKNLEEAAKVYMEVHKTEEDVKRSEAEAIVKRQEAQALMEAADLATYRATMALRIAEALSCTNILL